MRVAILYICTGKYDVFWKDFFISAERFFLPNYLKEYFVFTDANLIFGENENSNIHKIFQENLGWPNNTLLRFEMFHTQKEKLKCFDYIFFMNANLLFIEEVKNDLIDQEKNLIVVKHPGFYNKQPKDFTYERSKKSTAYIPFNEGMYYVAGGFNGGKSEHYLELIRILKSKIELDSKNDIIAIWHDESHLNRYIIDRSDLQILDPSYLYPEGWNIPFNKIIIVRDKNNWGGHRNLRKSSLVISNILEKYKKILQKL